MSLSRTNGTRQTSGRVSSGKKSSRKCWTLLTNSKRHVVRELYHLAHTPFITSTTFDLSLWHEIIFQDIKYDKPPEGCFRAKQNEVW
jgi:hypothetical protein